MPPVGAFLASAAFAAGASVTVTNAFLGIGALGAVFSAAGSIALSLGLSYAVSLLNRPQQQRPSDGQQEFRQSIPARVFHYGRVKTAGPLAYYESSGGDLFKIVMLSARQIDDIETVYINDRAVNLASSGENQTDPEEDRVWVERKFGAADQDASSFFVNGGDGWSAAPGWTADHRLRGTAYLAVICKGAAAEDFQARYPSEEPAFAALIRGALLYDPRDGATRYSDNAALAVLDYLIHSDGYDRPIGKLYLPSFVAMANRCDELVPLASGGTERRYRIATTVALTEARKDVLQRLLEACDGQLYPRSDGLIAIRGGAFEAPTVTIDADAGHIIEANFAPPNAMDRYNELAIQYLDPALDYVENEGEPWQDPEDIAATGILVTQSLPLLQVPSHSQARRLAKIRMARDNADWTAEIVTNLAGMNALGERVIQLKWPELDIDDAFWVEGGPELSGDLTTVHLKLRSASSASYAWTTAEEGTSTAIPPDTSPVYNLNPPALTLTQAGGPTIVATWTPDAALNRSYEVEYRQGVSTAWTPMVVTSSRDEAVSNTVTVGETYHVRIRVSAGPEAVGPWSGEYDITIV